MQRWGDAATSQGARRSASSYQKLEEERQASPPEPGGGVQPCQYLDLRLLASRTVREYILVALSHPVWL